MHSSMHSGLESDSQRDTIVMDLFPINKPGAPHAQCVTPMVWIELLDIVSIVLYYVYLQL